LQINQEDLFVVSDDDDIDNNGKDGSTVDSEKQKEDAEPSTEENENQWQAIISQWIDEANHENQVEDNSDELLLNGDFLNQDFLVGTRNIHPADDQKAKWELSTLFVDNLEPPTYIGTDYNFSDN
jgi:hypothetical protein